MSTIFDFKSVRCPLYGFIGLSKNEDSILNTYAVQRLSRIKQLAHTYLVYPSAVHTRLEHSLGTLFLASRMCDQLRIHQDQKRVVRIAAFLHDLGQGPFSHVWEAPMRLINGREYSHEDVTRHLIENDPELGKALGKQKQRVLDVLQGDSLSSDIISSSLDADKLDYLRRDSYHTGVAYGFFDIERVVRTVCAVKETDRSYLAVDEKGMDALESYRLARYAMQAQVYEHHTRLIADGMFQKAIKYAFEENCLTEEDFRIDGDANHFSKIFLTLDDFSIQHHIIQNSNGIAGELVQRIRSRNLLKRAFEAPLTRMGVPDVLRRKKIVSMNRDEVSEVEQKVAEELEIPPAYVIVHLQSINIKLYERFEETLGTEKKPIYVRRKDGVVFSLDEESPFSASLTPIRRLYLFCPKKHVPKAKSIAENVFEVKSIF